MTSRTQASRFERSLKRNLNELARAILNWRALKGLEAADPLVSIDFVLLAYWALFNEAFTHAMRAFDEHRGAASFWFLYSCEPSELDQAAGTAGIEIGEIRSLSKALKLIRNKTHFHIDKNAVFDPPAVWKRAAIKGPDFERLVRSTFDMLNVLHRTRWRNDFWLPDYDGADARAIGEFAESLRMKSWMAGTSPAMTTDRGEMAHYIAIIHKEPDSSYGVSFPDVPGVITVADTSDEALFRAAEVLAFAAEDWEHVTDTPFPEPRNLDALHRDAEFARAAKQAVVAAIPFAAHEAA